MSSLPSVLVAALLVAGATAADPSSADPRSDTAADTAADLCWIDIAFMKSGCTNAVSHAVGIDQARGPGAFQYSNGYPLNETITIWRGDTQTEIKYAKVDPRSMDVQYTYTQSESEVDGGGSYMSGEVDVSRFLSKGCIEKKSGMTDILYDPNVAGKRPFASAVSSQFRLGTCNLAQNIIHSSGSPPPDTPWIPADGGGPGTLGVGAIIAIGVAVLAVGAAAALVVFRRARGRWPWGSAAAAAEEDYQAMA